MERSAAGTSASLTHASLSSTLHMKERTGEMTTIDELERRVVALETAQKETAKTQTWMASTLGRIASVQDQHTVAIAELQADMREVKADLKGLRADLPAMLADAVREGLKQ
jgi:hypothetical protein